MAARGWAWVTLGLALLGLAWRVALGGAPPATFDEVSFQRALTQFDLLAFEPHFPGYALSVFLARIPAALGSAAPYAWSAGLLGLALTPALYRAGGGGPGGTLAVAALALSPLALSVGARPLADGGASALAAGGVALAWRALEAGRAPWAAAWILGAAAAAKPDYALFGSALLPGLAREGWRRRAGLLAAWALGPLAATWAAAGGAGGVAPLLAEAERFVRGHVSEWGGTVASDRGPRLARFGLPLGAAGGGPGLAGLALGGVLARYAPLQTRRAALWAALPYALYTLYGQNLAHPRHLLPLALVGALLAGRGLNRLPARAAWRAALAASLILLLFSGSARETAFQRARGRPADRLLALLELEDPLETRLYAGFLARPLRERAPTLEVRPARDLAHVAALLAADPTPPRVVWVAQDVRGAERLEPVVEDGELRVYRWDRGRAGL